MKPPTPSTIASPHPTMESLALPRDLYWDGKTEPTSPLPCSELFASTDTTGNWLHDDNFANDIKFSPENTLDLKPLLADELIYGDDIVIELYDFKGLKEGNWSVASSSDLIVSAPAASGILSKLPHGSSEHSAYDAATTPDAVSFETAILTQLTPPQSPPQHSRYYAHVDAPTTTTIASALLQPTPSSSLAPSPTPSSSAAFSPSHSSAIETLPHDSSFAAWINSNHNNNNNNSNSNTSAAGVLLLSAVVDINDDIARDVQIVDDIVNTRAKELFNWNDECESLISGTSFSSPATSQRAESIADDDWLADTISSAASSYAPSASSGASSPSHCDNSAAASPQSAATVSGKKRPRPYGRGVEDRKIRKKEQNKNAATRYRQKKKLEMEHVLGKEQELCARHDELLRQLGDAKREEKYLKSLIREFYTRKMKK